MHKDYTNEIEKDVKRLVGETEVLINQTIKKLIMKLYCCTGK